jgi:hypothetical protein
MESAIPDKGIYLYGFGEHSEFKSGNGKLSAEFGVGIASDIIVAPVYIGTLKADVNYINGEFRLENLRFQADQK